MLVDVRQNPPMICPHCGHAMNHHGNKMLEYTEGSNVTPDYVVELHSCAECGNNDSRPAV